MKRNHVLLSFLLLFFLSSCTVEKRVHLRGYHVEWHSKSNKQNHAVNNENLNKATPKHDFKGVTLAEVSGQLETNIVSYPMIAQKSHKDAEDYSVQERQEFSASDNQNRVKIRSSGIEGNLAFEDSAESDDQESQPLKVIGWVLIILGLIFLLIISILVGIVLMLLGLVFVIAAPSA